MLKFVIKPLERALVRRQLAEHVALAADEVREVMGLLAQERRFTIDEVRPALPPYLNVC